MSDPKNWKFPGVAFVLAAFSGCGMLGSNKAPNVEEVPPYYQKGTYVNVPMDHQFMEREDPARKSTVSSRSELDKLQKEADAWSEEQARQKAAEEERADTKKKGFMSWFGSGDRMSGMSGEAKDINKSLDAKRAGVETGRF